MGCNKKHATREEGSVFFVRVFLQLIQFGLEV
jgi:hypothetical protein